jgi:L-aspartate oxidase
MESFDFLVIGGGIAGLTYALQVADAGTVAVLFKKDVRDASTAWAQGGIAAVSAGDDHFSLHIEDTLVAGAGLCNPATVDLVVREAPERINDLLKIGTSFDKDGDNFHLHKEGGHSRRRIYHTADATGAEIHNSLLRAAQSHANIKFLPFHSAIDLITTHKLKLDRSKPNRVLGAYVLNDAGRVQAVRAEKVLVATGGAGKVYLYTSNPDIATGDGIAMCYRAGVPVANMEFFQFHPTCLYHPQAKSFLITEAMRGEGALLRRMNGERFMDAYHPQAELAPRDIVARSIDFEMKQHGEDYVLLDITHRQPDFIKEHFPTIYERCLSFGYDITSTPIPVVPAAHYCCGGVCVDEHGLTTIENLYVAGECAHTGLHGANRLASNSLLEGLVFGYRAAQHSLKHRTAQPEMSLPHWNPGSATNSDEQVVISQSWEELRRFMWNYVGIVRTKKRLERALHRNANILSEIKEYYWNFTITSDLIELRNLSVVADLVIRCALSRRESRGLHYNIDYPDQCVALVRDTVMDPRFF